MDNIFEDMITGFKETEASEDLPGGGENYCTECARHFITAEQKLVHIKTKIHKRRVKTLKTEIPYTIAESELAAGLQTDNGPGRNKAITV